MRHTIRLTGHIPAKKNNWRPKQGGGMYCSKSTDLAPLLLQVRSQWKHAPIEAATIHAVITVRDQRGDLDNKYTTLQDLLVQGGVIAGDNIKRIASYSCRAVVGSVEGATVEILAAERGA